MGRFRSASNQAKAALKKHLAIGKPKVIKSDGKVHSLGTHDAYTGALKGVAQFIKDHRLTPNGKGLGDLNVNIAISYLEMRSQEKLSQSALNKDRQAMEMILGEKLPIIKSEYTAAQNSRAYPPEQAIMIGEAQTEKHSLSTQIALDAGLRAHELLTLRPVEDRNATVDREWRDDRFAGRGAVVIYTVNGKGGLVREIALSSTLSEQLEALRLDEPRIVTDRGIYYEQFYNLGGGKQWSDSFTKASERVLGWTNGGHGLRHSYAQNRMCVLMRIGYAYKVALEIV